MWQNQSWSVQRNQARARNYHVRTTVYNIHRKTKAALYEALMRYPPYIEVRLTRLANQCNAQGICTKGEDWNNVHDEITRILNSIGASGLSPDWDLNVLGYLGHLTDNEQLCVPGIDPYFAPSPAWYPHFVDVTREYSRPVMTSTMFLSAEIPSNLWRTDENQERNILMAIRFLVPERELRFNEPPEPTYPSPLYTKVHQPSFAYGRFANEDQPQGIIDQNKRTMHLKQCPTIAGMYAYFCKGIRAHSGGDLVRQLPVDIRPAPLNLTVMPAIPRPVRPTTQANAPSTSGQADSRNIRPSRPRQPRAPRAPGAPPQFNQPRPQGPVMPRPPTNAEMRAFVPSPAEQAEYHARPLHPHEPIYDLQGAPDDYDELITRAAARNPPLFPSPLQFSTHEPPWVLGPGGTMKVTPYKSFPGRPPPWTTPPPFPERRSAEWHHMDSIRISKWYHPDIRWFEHIADAGYLENSLRYGYSIGPNIRCGFVAYGEVTDYGERPIDLPAGPSHAEQAFLPAEWHYIPAIYIVTQDAVFFFTRHYRPVFIYCPLPPYNGTLWWNKGVTTLDIDMSLGSGLTDSEPDEDHADDEDHHSDDTPPDDAPGGGPSRGPRGPPPDGGSSSGHHEPSRKRSKHGHGPRPRSGLSFNDLDFEPFEEADHDAEKRMHDSMALYVDEDDDQGDNERQHDPFLMYVDETEYRMNAATSRPIDIPHHPQQQVAHSAPAPKRTFRTRKARDRLRSDGAAARSMPPPLIPLPAKRKTSRRYKSQNNTPREPSAKIDRHIESLSASADTLATENDPPRGNRTVVPFNTITRQEVIPRETSKDMPKPERPLAVLLRGEPPLGTRGSMADRAVRFNSNARTVNHAMAIARKLILMPEAVKSIQRYLIHLDGTTMRKMATHARSFCTALITKSLHHGHLLPYMNTTARTTWDRLASQNGLQTQLRRLSRIPHQIAEETVDNDILCLWGFSNLILLTALTSEDVTARKAAQQYYNTPEYRNYTRNEHCVESTHAKTPPGIRATSKVFQHLQSAIDFAGGYDPAGTPEDPPRAPTFLGNQPRTVKVRLPREVQFGAFEYLAVFSPKFIFYPHPLVYADRLFLGGGVHVYVYLYVAHLAAREPNREAAAILTKWTIALLVANPISVTTLIRILDAADDLCITSTTDKWAYFVLPNNIGFDFPQRVSPLCDPSISVLASIMYASGKQNGEQHLALKLHDPTKRLLWEVPEDIQRISKRHFQIQPVSVALDLASQLTKAEDMPLSHFGMIAYATRLATNTQASPEHPLPAAQVQQMIEWARAVMPHPSGRSLWASGLPPNNDATLPPTELTKRLHNLALKAITLNIVPPYLEM